MDERAYWRNKHLKYLNEDWIDKPSLFAKQAVKFFPKGGKLLDLAAGQGQDSRYFRKMGYEVWCTDFLPDALKLAQEKAHKENLNIQFMNVDMRKEMPFEDEFFDIVFSNMGLHYFDEKDTKRLFGEISRILKPNGVLACLLNTEDDSEIPASEKLEPGLYKTPSDLIKRFFDLNFLHKMTDEYFETTIADKKGETYKDIVKTLVRFVGRKR